MDILQKFCSRYKLSNDNYFLYQVAGDETNYEFSFDRIFGPETQQSDVFDYVAKPVIESN